MKETKNKFDLWHKEKQNEKVNSLKKPWYQTVMKLLPDLSGKKVLEIGCGRGIFATYLAEKVPDSTFYATDFSDAAIDIAIKNKNESIKNLIFQVENAEQLSFDENSFDYIISCETMEHVLKPRKMAQEMYRVLKPGGEFILTTENYFNGMTIAWIKAWISGQPFSSGAGLQPHENYFLYFMVSNYLKKAGLQITKTTSNHFQWLLLPRVNPSKLCTEDFDSKFFKSLFKIFGRHYTYIGKK